MYAKEVLKRKELNDKKELEFLIHLYEHRLHGSFLDLVDPMSLTRVPMPRILPPLVKQTHGETAQETESSGVDLHEASVFSHQSFDTCSQDCKLVLLSCVDGLHAPREIWIMNTTTSIGTSVIADQVIHVSNLKVGGRLAQIHCYLEGHVTESYELNVYIYDNHTSWGTIVIGQSGIVKARPKKVSGHLLRSGDLICIGAVKNVDSRSDINVRDLLDACVIYRVLYQLRTVIP